MTRLQTGFLWVVAILALTSPAIAQMPRMPRDPLTAAETDQLREVSDEPAQKLKLYIKFARARMMAIEQLDDDPKLAADRGQRLHDLLEDLSSLVDEVGDNLDSFARRRDDIRKPLHEVVQMNDDFQLKLRALQEQAKDPKNAKEAEQYQFALDDAVDSVNADADAARDILDRQNTAAEEAKEAKKHKKK